MVDEFYYIYYYIFSSFLDQEEVKEDEPQVKDNIALYQEYEK